MQSQDNYDGAQERVDDDGSVGPPVLSLTRTRTDARQYLCTCRPRSAYLVLCLPGPLSTICTVPLRALRLRTVQRMLNRGAEAVLHHTGVRAYGRLVPGRLARSDTGRSAQLHGMHGGITMGLA